MLARARTLRIQASQGEPRPRGCLPAPRRRAESRGVGPGRAPRAGLRRHRPRRGRGRLRRNFRWCAPIRTLPRRRGRTPRGRNGSRRGRRQGLGPGARPPGRPARPPRIRADRPTRRRGRRRAGRDVARRPPRVGRAHGERQPAPSSCAPRRRSKTASTRRWRAASSRCSTCAAGTVSSTPCARSSRVARPCTTACRSRGRMAVLVQPFLVPDAGGVMFGADPVTGRTDRFVVAAVPGGPDQLVSGEVDGVTITLTARGKVVESTRFDRRRRHQRARARRTAEARGRRVRRSAGRRVGDRRRRRRHAAEPADHRDRQRSRRDWSGVRARSGCRDVPERA